MATPRNYRRAYRQIERFLEALGKECARSRAPEAGRYLDQARAAFDRVDPDVESEGAELALDHALSYGHHALNSLLRHYRVPTHSPEDFAKFYDVAAVPFREPL